MSDEIEPVVLDLAPLPREQYGPFLMLGVDKDADPREIEARWAQRVIWARTRQVRLALEDINWAKETLLDRDKRVAADASSLNPDVATGELRELLARYGPLEPEVPSWRPLEAPPPRLDDLPAIERPSIEDVRASVPIPEIPLELPAVAAMLDELASVPLDPWAYTPPEPTP